VAVADESADDAVEARAHAAKLNPQEETTTDTSADLSAVFSEWQFGPLTLPNRIVKSAAGVSSMSYKDGVDNDETIAYYTNIARGGCKMLYFDDITVLYDHFEFPPVFPPFKKITDWTSDQLKAVVDAVHAEGSYIGYQLASLGMGLQNSANDSVSQSQADVITHDEIELFIQDSVNAAVLLKEIGFDAVEINSAGSNLGQNFMSRNRNTRDDEYGPQSIENRARFTVNIVKGIKEACGDDFPVQVLMNGVEDNDGSIGQNWLHTTVEEAAQIAKLLEEAGADSLHIRLGPSTNHICEFMSDLYFTGRGIEGTTAFGTQFDFKRHWQGKLKADQGGLGLNTYVAAQIKQAVSIPVGCVTYMDPARDPEFFNSAIEDGLIDFMLMNRPLNCDFEYVHKLEQGRYDEIRPCTRCGTCYLDTDRDGSYLNWCRVNGAYHRAYRDNMPEGYEPRSIVITPDGSTVVNALPEGFDALPAEHPRKVLVVGGGPAGMETARVAASRGHDVTLYEKSSTLGGLLPFAEMVKGPHENLSVFNAYLQHQLDLEGVSVVLDTEVTPELIAEMAPDALVLATGGVRRTSGFESTEGTRVIPMTELIGAELGNDVVVLGSNAQAVDVAQWLLSQGKNVNIVTESDISLLGWGQSEEVRAYTNPMLYALGCRVWPLAQVTAVGNGTATVAADSGVDVELTCSAVVEAMDMLPNTELADGFEGDVYVAGDCMDPYNIANAITSGTFVGRAL
jgi:2,4-dienoyl-CoA reductase-like NADH-dependent reductase (Old Yellow Enzyme family)/thioredoxin reductase